MRFDHGKRGNVSAAYISGRLLGTVLISVHKKPAGVTQQAVCVQSEGATVKLNA